VIYFLYPETKGPTLEELGDRKPTEIRVTCRRDWLTWLAVFEDENPMEKGIMKGAGHDSSA
jgi:hypothetical protein